MLFMMVLNIYYEVSRCTILLILILYFCLTYVLVDGYLNLTRDLCDDLSFLEITPN